MSGIVGVFHLDRRPAALSELETLAAASNYHARSDERFRTCASIGIGHRHARVTPESLAEEQPLVSTSGVIISFDGRLDNRDELRQSSTPPPLESNRAASLPDAALVLAAYEDAGDGFVSQLNGDFAFALFDSRRQQLVLARDVMGARPLYYCSLPATLLFASEINSLLGDPRVAARPDEAGVADLVLDKWDDGRRTCFEGIYSVPPGHALIATPDTITLQRHWAFDPRREIRCSDDEYVGRFRLLFEQAVRRRARSARTVAVTLSGGVDSSSIFCQAAVLNRAAMSPAVRGVSMTFPAGSAADEHQFVDEIERAYDARVARVQVTDLQLLRDANRVVRHLEMPGLFWDAYGDMCAAAQRMDCSVMLDGYFGDQVLFGRRYLVDLARSCRWTKIHHDLREFSGWMTDASGYFQYEFGRALLRSLPPRSLFRTAKKYATRRRLTRYPDCYRKGLLERLLDRQMGRYESNVQFASRHAEEYYRCATAGHDLAHVEQQCRIGLMNGIEVSHPFRDRDIVAFLMAIPGEAVNYRGIPKGLLREALSGILPDAIRDRRSKADFSTFHTGAVLRDLPAMRQLLTRDCLSVQAGFVEGNMIERTVQNLATRAAEAGNTMATWQLGNLTGLEIWLRQFFGDQFRSGVECTTS